jgi:hypothetical protein
LRVALFGRWASVTIREAACWLAAATPHTQREHEIVRLVGIVTQRCWRLESSERCKRSQHTDKKRTCFLSQDPNNGCWASDCFATPAQHGPSGARLCICAPCSPLTAASMLLDEDTRRLDEGECCKPAEPLRLAAASPAEWLLAILPSRCCDPLPPAADAMPRQLIGGHGVAGFGPVSVAWLMGSPLDVAGVACSSPVSNMV